MSPEQLTLVVALLPVAVSLSGVLYKLLVSLLPQNMQYEMESAIHEVVKAVEQTMPGSTNEQKKAEAVKLAEAVLKSFRLPVNATTLDVLIESAVAALPATGERKDAAVSQSVDSSGA